MHRIPFLAALVCIAGASLQAQSTINVDFGSPDTAAPFSGNALAPAAGTVWNNITSAGTTSNLLDSQGNATGVSLQFSPSGFWHSNSAYSTGELTTTYGNLIFDYAYANGSSRIFHLTGLAVGQAYDLYLYSQGDSPNQGATFSLGAGTANQSSLSSTGTNFTTFSEGANYVVFRNLQANGSGQVTITLATNPATTFGALNGLQLTAIPEPSTYAALAGAAALGLAVWHRRRSRRA